MISIINGSILDSKEKYICHQCNCLSNTSAGLAKSIFDKFPFADIYSSRTDPDLPGTISIKGNGTDQRYIVNILAQYYPGPTKCADSSLDGTAIREKYFYKALLKLAKVPDLESVAFPFKIGCGLAGGNWDYYLGVLNNFAKFIEEKQNAKTFIYKY